MVNAELIFTRLGLKNTALTSLEFLPCHGTGVYANSDNLREWGGGGLTSSNSGHACLLNYMYTLASTMCWCCFLEHHCHIFVSDLRRNGSFPFVQSSHSSKRTQCRLTWPGRRHHVWQQLIFVCRYRVTTARRKARRRSVWASTTWSRSGPTAEVAWTPTHSNSASSSRSKRYVRCTAAVLWRVIGLAAVWCHQTTASSFAQYLCQWFAHL